ncbi:MAG: hypothetical protein IPI17_17770 [Nitrosomonas sp.]|nr:hypothetical protein [Nitrosomonas sp.]
MFTPASEPVSVAEVKHFCGIDEVNQEPAPGALTVALGSGAGNVDNGAHRYVVTFVTSDGETQAGDVSSSVTVVDKTVRENIAFRNTCRRLNHHRARFTARRRAAQPPIAHHHCAIQQRHTRGQHRRFKSWSGKHPSTNTTGDQLLNVLIKSARQYAEQLLGRYLITQTVDLYLDEFPTQAINMRPLQSVTDHLC